jgi:hypothetical protein
MRPVEEEGHHTMYFHKGVNKSNAYVWLFAHTQAKAWMEDERLFTGASALNWFIAAELYAIHVGGRLKFSMHSLRRVSNRPLHLDPHWT